MPSHPHPRSGAARLGGVVLESQGIWQPGVAGPNFQRQDTGYTQKDEADSKHI